MTRRKIRTTTFEAPDRKRGMDVETIRECLAGLNPLTIPKFYVGFGAQVQKIVVQEEVD